MKRTMLYTQPCEFCGVQVRVYKEHEVDKPIRCRAHKNALIIGKRTR